MNISTDRNQTLHQLVDELRRLEATHLDLSLVPLNGNKQPLGDGWQNRAFSATQLIEAIQTGGVKVPLSKEIKKIQLQGFGLLTGRPITVDGVIYYLMAIDQDGASAAGKILELSGNEPLPKTVAFTSGRVGRCQYLFLVPEEYKNAIRTKKVKTGIQGDDGSSEQLEFRWTNLQSVLPPSVHPTTGQYRWVTGCAIDEIEIAIAPNWVIEQMLIDPTPQVPSLLEPLSSRPSLHNRFDKQWTDIDYAISYLNALSSYRADDYDDWLTVGMALHSVDDSLLAEWDKWSSQSTKYKPGDCEKKWKSFSSNGGVSLGTLGHMAKQEGWRSPFSQKMQVAISEDATSQNADKIPNNGNHRNNNNGNGKSCPSPERFTQTCMRERIAELLNQHLSPSAQSEAFNLLSLTTGWNIREIRALAAELEADLDLEDSRSERHTQLLELETHKQRTLNLSQFLPATYADPIIKMARWIEAPTAALLTGLLPTFASCLHPATRVIVKESIGFVEAPIIYAGIVTESGQRKSPLMNAILDPLQELQLEEEERYRRDKAEYDTEYQQWQASKEMMPQDEWKAIEPLPPTPLREFYVDKATIEAIDSIKHNQPDTSLLWKKDELSGLLNGYNAYKGGRGEDKESVLTGWNGRGVKKNLKSGERISLKQDAMSIFGAIQDATLQKKMGNFDDEQGEWGRFLWCLIPLNPLRLPDSDTSFQLAFLKSLYQRARQLKSQNYRFAFDAQILYDNYHWQLEKRRVAHHQRGMRAAIAKMEGYTARLALVLHLIWELEAGKQEPNSYIPRERVEAAMNLSEFFLSQVALIHSEGAAALGEGGLTPRLSAILNKLRQFGELTARKLQAAVSWLRKEKPVNIRRDLIELAQLGYGKLVGAGNRLKLILTKCKQAPPSHGGVSCTADAADETADRAADESVRSQPFDLRTVEPIHTQTADSADNLTSVTDEPSLSRDSYQIHQPIDSLPSNSVSSNTLAADERSTVASTESTESDENVSWLIQLLVDLEYTPAPHPRFSSNKLLIALIDEAEQKASFCYERLTQTCPNYWERLGLALEAVTDSLPTSETETVQQPTLAQLQVLLLACRTLTALEQLKQTHAPDLLEQAYQSLSFDRQLQIDGIAALAVSHPVFKYTGSSQTAGDSIVQSGMLVYLDPHARQTDDTVWAWALDCNQPEQREPVALMKNCLIPVPKPSTRS
ncbi:MAG: DUF3987 domain-containing protein [Hydrococcus sp. Prado102]|jgi:hypothetical protein|nr:DUF3987 domain-containing protein [Hydrococcus sp. Prado102]